MNAIDRSRSIRMRHAIAEGSQLSCAGRMRRKDQGCALELTTWGIGRDSSRDDFMRDEMRWKKKEKSRSTSRIEGYEEK